MLVSLSFHYLSLSLTIFSLSFPIFPYLSLTPASDFAIFPYPSLSFHYLSLSLTIFSLSFHYPSLSFHYLSLSLTKSSWPVSWHCWHGLGRVWFANKANKYWQILSWLSWHLLARSYICQGLLAVLVDSCLQKLADLAIYLTKVYYQ